MGLGADAVGGNDEHHRLCSRIYNTLIHNTQAPLLSDEYGRDRARANVRAYSLVYSQTGLS
jgi:uncharacterized protein (UPF0332 family)